MILLQKLQRFFEWREQVGAGARRVSRDAVVAVDGFEFYSFGNVRAVRHFFSVRSSRSPAPVTSVLSS